MRTLTRTERRKLSKEEIQKHNKEEKMKSREGKIIQLLEDYIKNLIHGRYFLARANMLAQQIENNKIEEKIDCKTKTKEYMLAEFALQKMQAIRSFRYAFFFKRELKLWEATEERISAAEKDYYEGRIVRETYEDIYEKGKRKTEFVDAQPD